MDNGYDIGCGMVDAGKYLSTSAATVINCFMIMYYGCSTSIARVAVLSIELPSTTMISFTAGSRCIFWMQVAIRSASFSVGIMTDISLGDMSLFFDWFWRMVRYASRASSKRNGVHSNICAVGGSIQSPV